MMRTSACLLLVVSSLFRPQLAGATQIETAPPPRQTAAAHPWADALASPNPGSPCPQLPTTNLAPAKPMFDACIYKYAVSTTNPECQAYVNQGLGMYYSYVWIDAARAFETALQHDPECAYAWLMLSRSLEKWGRSGGTITANPFHAVVGGFVHAKLPEGVGKSAGDYSLAMARQLMPKANSREQLLIQARLQEKGMWPGVGPDERKKKAQQSLDELL